MKLSQQTKRAGLIIASAIACVTIIFLFTKKEAPAKNGFKRVFYSGEPVLQHMASCPQEVLEVNLLYAGNLLLRTVEPGTLYVTSLDLKEFRPRYLDPSSFPNGNKFFTSAIDSILFILSFNPRYIEAVNYPKKTSRRHAIPYLFSPGLAVSKHEVVLRAFDSTGTEKIFRKINTATGQDQREKEVSPKMDDGGMLTDGILAFDKVTGKLFYTYYFGNGFICMDTNLNLLYRTRTIDTFTRFQAMITKRSRSITHVKPPTSVNKNCCADGGRLFIESRIRADNEDPRLVNTTSVIDVYRETDGQYAGSFYLPFQKGSGITGFKVIGSDLLAVHGKWLAIYDLAFLNL